MNRRTSRLGATTLVAALAFTLTGCTTEPARTAAPVDATVTATASATSTASATGTKTSTAVPAGSRPTLTLNKNGELDYCQGQAPFTGAAADRFGAKNVMAAYCHMAKFGMEEGFIDSLIFDREYKAVEFAFIKDYLTPETAAEWDKIVQVRLGPDKKAHEKAAASILALTTHGLAHPEMRAPAEPPYTINRSFSPATTRIGPKVPGPGDSLVMEMTFKADLRATRNGKPVTYPLTRDVKVILVPGGAADRPWLIAGWSGVLNAGGPVPA